MVLNDSLQKTVNSGTAFEESLNLNNSEHVTAMWALKFLSSGAPHPVR